MPDTSQSIESERPFPSFPKAKSSASLLQEALAFLAFEAHGLRIGLEVSLCFFLYIVLSIVFPWQVLGIEPSWSALYSWFFACITVAVIDQVLFFRASYFYQTALKFDAAGMHDKALETIERSGPDSSLLIKCPPRLYHQRRAEFFTHQGLFNDAEDELLKAQQFGLDQYRFHLAKLQMLRAQKLVDEAIGEVEKIKDILGESPVAQIEEGLVHWLERSEFWKAKKLFKAASEGKEKLHPLGESTKVLGAACHDAILLVTGEAEKALDGLNASLGRLLVSALQTPRLRPLVARLFLIRARYLATHKYPKEALSDVANALRLCSHQEHVQDAMEVRCELRDRHGEDFALEQETLPA